MFSDHIKASGETQRVWAERLGISTSYLSDLLKGRRQPSLELAVRVERLTGGAVSAASWVGVQPAPTAPEEDAA